MGMTWFLLIQQNRFNLNFATIQPMAIVERKGGNMVNKICLGKERK